MHSLSFATLEHGGSVVGGIGHAALGGVYEQHSRSLGVLFDTITVAVAETELVDGVHHTLARRQLKACDRIGVVTDVAELLALLICPTPVSE